MLAEMELEKQKREAKPTFVSLVKEIDTVKIANSPEENGFVLGGESDKGTAGKLKTVYFEFSQTDLTEDQKELLKENAKEISLYPSLTLTLSAHSDILGKADFNRRLSLKRAKKVFDQLASYGVNKNKLNILNAGSSNPLVEVEYKPIETIEDFEYFKNSLSQNRRVNFIVDSIGGNKFKLERKIAQQEEDQSITVDRSSLLTKKDIDLNNKKTYKNVYFNVSSNTLSEKQQSQLDKNIETFKLEKNKKLKIQVFIKGTDTKKLQSNLELGTARAKEIYDFIISKDIPTSLFSVKISKLDLKSSLDSEDRNLKRGITFELEDIPEEKVKPKEVASVAESEPKLKDSHSSDYQTKIIDNKSFSSELAEILTPKALPKSTTFNSSPDLKTITFNRGSSSMSDVQNEFLGNNEKILNDNELLKAKITIYAQDNPNKKVANANLKMTEDRIESLKTRFKELALKNRIVFEIKSQKVNPDNYGKAFFNYELSKEALSQLAINKQLPDDKISSDNLKDALFESKKASLSEDQKSIIRDNIAWLKEHSDYKVMVTINLKGKNKRTLRINSNLVKRRTRVLREFFKSQNANLDVKVITPDISSYNASKVKPVYRQIRFTAIPPIYRSISEEKP